jgi:hypothetical protein
MESSRQPAKRGTDLREYSLSSKLRKTDSWPNKLRTRESERKTPRLRLRCVRLKHSRKPNKIEREKKSLPNRRIMTS